MLNPLVINFIFQFLSQTPELISELETLFSGGTPTQADWNALRAKLVMKAYASYDPAPISTPPATAPVPASAAAPAVTPSVTPTPASTAGEEAAAPAPLASSPAPAPAPAPAATVGMNVIVH